VVIAGQGPEAFGMPEMFTPMQHINANRRLRRLVALVSDGRYSGVTYGAAIGHVTPEACNGGAIGLLQTGDLLHLQLRGQRLDLLDAKAFAAGRAVPWEIDLGQLRHGLRAERRERMQARRRQIAATNRLHGVTDAGRGVVPLAVAEEATQVYEVD
jgi:dihydroxy-acid dehydratase